jgi:hypothetical protein
MDNARPRAGIGGETFSETFKESAMLLTKHEGATFQNQTIYISGQAFVRCTFIACTLVLRETVYYLEGCTFDRCNWHVDRVLMWGSPESIQEVKALIAMIESVQQQQQASAGQGAPAGTLVNPTPNFTGDPTAVPQPG